LNLLTEVLNSHFRRLTTAAWPPTRCRGERDTTIGWSGTFQANESGAAWSTHWNNRPDEMLFIPEAMEDQLGVDAVARSDLGYRR
jgi:hypothetical protein